MNKSNCVINDDDQDWGNSGGYDLGVKDKVPLVPEKKKFPQETKTLQKTSQMIEST